MVKKRYFIRYFVVMAIFIIAVFIYGGKLLNMQIANAEQYQVKVNEDYRREKFIIPAVRGEIFDRNGVPLVTNQLVYKLTIDGAKIPNTRGVMSGKTTEHIINLVYLIKLYGGEIVPHTLPVTYTESGYSYSMAMSESKNIRDNFYQFLSDNNIPQYISPGELINRLTNKYKLDELLPPEEREQEFFMTILGVCYELDRRGVIPKQTRYTISTEINEMLVSAITESAHNYPGAEVIPGYKRVYPIPHSAPHLIGSIGPITAETWERYEKLGYPMDATVGLNGVEAAFEEYLRGQNGEVWRYYDQDGNVIKEEYVKDPVTGEERKPVAGKNVYLTIDIELQQVTEYSLKKTIDRIVNKNSQTYANPSKNGADAKAGASAIMKPNGEVLALANYPSYNLATFNEDFAELNAREEDRPLLNRALRGQYEPGSVFKIATSVAALCSGNLTIHEQIQDHGIYMKYAPGYTPACWLYHVNRGNHGSIRVDEALKHSCNYFYFVVGERMAENDDIELLNSYVRRLGLGVYTGIEVEETKGTIASRAYKEARASTWHPGDTLQAAIGQSDYGFSPLQMVTMLNTVLNSGTRYEARLLLYVKEYGSDEIYYAPEPKVADHIEIEPEYVNAIKIGMNDVTDEGGTAAILFKNLPGLTTGGKTGTAQVPTGSPNATIVTFAPYAEPEIAMSVVIENGRHGTWAGFTSEDVFAYYFGYKTFNQSLDLPDEPEVSEEPKESEVMEEEIDEIQEDIAE